MTQNFIQTNNIFLKNLTIFFIVISLSSCSQEKIDYHLINQPKYSVDNFVEKSEIAENKIYSSIKFQNGKRQSYTDINILEHLIRSLKGNIKSIKISEINSDSILWNTDIFEFDKKGSITKNVWAFQDYDLKDITSKDTLFTKLDTKSNDSISIRTDYVEFVFFKGKLYAENSNMYRNFPHKRYYYHDNGNKSLEKSLTNWETSYYNNLGILDSVVDQNKETNPTEYDVEKYFYNNELIEKYTTEQNKISDKKSTTSYARVVTAKYHKATDLPTYVEETSYQDNYKTTGSKETHTYTYNEKNELINTLHTFDGEDPKHMEFESNYQYEYDKEGNWTKIILTSFHRNKPEKKFTTQYLIYYEYY